MKAVAGKPDFAAVLKVLPEETHKVISSLSPEDLEILAYLIACPSEARANTEHSGNNRGSSYPRPHSKNGVPIHIFPDSPNKRSSSATAPSPALNAALQSRQPALFECSCFQCYTSYWGRWGASPNHGIIDEAISLYEEHISRKPTSQKKKKYEKGEKKKNEKGEKKKNEGRGKGQRGGGQEKLRKHEGTVKVAAVAAAEDFKSNDTGSDALVASNLAGESNPPKPLSPTKKAKGGKDHPQRSSGKERPLPKGKSSRIAPFVEDGAMGNLEDCVEVSCVVVEEDVCQGDRRLWSLMANRFWGFFS